jgi:hypothetical protein
MVVVRKAGEGGLRWNGREAEGRGQVAKRGGWGEGSGGLVDGGMTKGPHSERQCQQRINASCVHDGSRGGERGGERWDRGQERRQPAMRSGASLAACGCPPRR